MGSFELNDLAERSQVVPGTVRTVIDRCPAGWFTTTKLPTGAPGGQPSSYSITEEGRTGILAQLGQLPDIPSLRAPARSPEAAPLGLKAALQALKKLLTVTADDKDDVLAKIGRDIDWADAELMSSPASVENSKHRVQLEIARQLLIEQRAPLASIESLETSGFWQRDEARPTTLGDPSLVPHHDGTPVYIGALGVDAVKLAEQAKALVKGAAYMGCRAGITNYLNVRLINLDMSSRELRDKLRHALAERPREGSSFVDVFVCVNSKGGARTLTKSLDKLARLLGSRAAAVLDYDESPELARYVGGKAYNYRAHAHKNLSWLDSALLAATCESVVLTQTQPRTKADCGSARRPTAPRFTAAAGYTS